MLVLNTHIYICFWQEELVNLFVGLLFCNHESTTITKECFAIIHLGVEIRFVCKLQGLKGNRGSHP